MNCDRLLSEKSMLKVQGIMLPFSFRFPMLGEHRRWSQNGHNNSATLTSCAFEIRGDSDVLKHFMVLGHFVSKDEARSVALNRGRS